MAPPISGPTILHASAVALANAGLLITGASGSGKSTLTLQLMALGATLVADDRVVVEPRAEGGVTLSAPDTIAGLIEARGLGLIRAEHAPALLHLLVDLDHVEQDRLPKARETVIAGQAVRTLSKVESAAFPAMLIACLKGGLAER